MTSSQQQPTNTLPSQSSQRTQHVLSSKGMTAPPHTTLTKPAITDAHPPTPEGEYIFHGQSKVPGGNVQPNMAQVLDAARYRQWADTIAQLRPTTVLEITSAPTRLFDVVMVNRPSWMLNTWHVASPTGRASCIAATAQRVTPGVFVHQSPLGELAEHSLKANAIIISGMEATQHELAATIQSALAHLAPGGYLVVTALNSDSLHQQFQQSVGVPPLGAGFTQATLRALIHNCELTVVEESGGTLRPLPEADMAQCLPTLPAGTMMGLAALGQKYPQLASELTVVATYPH